MITDKRPGLSRVLGIRVSASLRDHRGIVVLLLLLGLVIITHDTFADGPPHRYVVHIAKQAHFIVAIYVLSYWLRRRRHTVLSRLAMALAVSVTLVLTFQHVFRILHPARWGVVYAELVDDFSTPVIAEGRWRILGDAAASIRVQNGALHLAPPAATQAFAELLLPSNPTFPGGQRWLPVGLYDAPYEEQLTWRGAAQVDREYFIVLVWNMLMVQRTPYGLHVTYPNTGGVLEGHPILFAFPEPPQAHTWRVLQRSSRISLAVDDQVVWSAAAAPGQSKQLPRFGESRSDALHAGKLTLDWVRYRRWLPRELRLGRRELLAPTRFGVDTVLMRLAALPGGRLRFDHPTVWFSSTDTRPPEDRQQVR